MSGDDRIENLQIQAGVVMHGDVAEADHSLEPARRLGREQSCFLVAGPGGADGGRVLPYEWIARKHAADRARSHRQPYTSPRVLMSLSHSRRSSFSRA